MPRIKSNKNMPIKPVEDELKKFQSKYKSFQRVKGMKDILPPDQKYWSKAYHEVGEEAKIYGFSGIDLPVIEQAGLFKRSIGESTDVVEKEMFTFVDKGNENVALRPEGTAGTVRAYIEHGMLNLPQPVKLFYTGPMFRYDKPQAGRFREFHQAGFEVIGDLNPVTDVQLILLGYKILKNLGINPVIQVNSIGCSACRPEYKKQLASFYKNKKNSLCEDCKKRMNKNVLRMLDCKEQECLEIREQAPQIVDHLCDNCKDHFIKVLEFLDELELPYTLSPYLVRGLDYYTKTVFEYGAEGNPETLSQSALGGGGRYDDLVELLGGRPTPAAGFSMGLDRIILAMKAANVQPEEIYQPDVFFAQLGNQARIKAIKFYEELTKNNIKASESFSKGGLKQQLELANKLGVKYTLILGQKEVIDGTLIIRDMEAGIQEIVDINKALVELKKKLNNQPGKDFQKIA